MENHLHVRTGTEFPDVDHIAHFVPDIDDASAALARLGFTLTPLSAQSHRPDADGPLVPAGTANRCVMLERGYLEFLTPTHHTPNAGQLRAAISRYTGIHLIAFGTQTADADFQRLSAGGFAPLAPLPLQRQVGTENGESTARFTVVRVAPAAMAEGRIQYCQHHTRDVVWQARWTGHANHAVGLAGVLICVVDPAEAARRYGRFSGLAAHRQGAAWRLDTARGYLLFMAPAQLQQMLAIVPPALPWIAGCVIDSDDMAATLSIVGGSVVNQRLLVKLPPSLGGIMLFQPVGSAPLTAP